MSFFFFFFSSRRRHTRSLCDWSSDVCSSDLKAHRDRLREESDDMANIAIHGFGRIGRSLLRAALKNDPFVPTVIFDIKDVGTLAALFEVDSNYGRWPEEVTTNTGRFVIGGREIPYVDSTKGLPNWKTLGADLVID